MTESKHDLPWRVNDIGTLGDIIGASGDPIAMVQPRGTLLNPNNQERQDFAAYIVKAANLHERLLDALKDFFALPNWENRIGPWNDIDAGLKKLYAAFAEAESEAP